MWKQHRRNHFDSLGKGESREKGDAESDGYEPSIAVTEDLEKAMDVGEPESAQGKH